MNLRPSVSRRTFIISGTLFLLMALFGYYFLVALPKKENQLISQRVRALDRIGLNFQEKYDVYRKNIVYQVGEDSLRLLLKVNQRLRAMQKADTPFSQDSVQSIQARADSLMVGFKKKFEQNATNQNIWPIEGTHQASKAIRFENLFATYFEPFFNPLKLENSFDGYIIYQDTALIYQNLPGEILRVPSRLYTELSKDSESEGRFVRHNLESRSPERYDKPRVYEAGTEVQLSAIDYRLFCTDFVTNNLSNNTRWTIYGLVTKEHFDAQKKKISFFGLIFLSLGLLLLLFSMPLMKLFFMSAIERLHQQDALLAPPMFVVCSAIVMLMILVTGKYYLSDIPAVDKQLGQLADTVAHRFNQELQEIHQLSRQLGEAPIPFMASNQVDSTRILQASRTDNTPLTNLLDSLTPSTISIPKLLSDNPDSVPDFTTYPFLRFIYWLDDRGVQQFEYSMLDKEHRYNDRPIYSNRAYFKTVHEGGGYSMISEDTLSFLQSIVSWTTGEPISVFSRTTHQTPLAFDHQFIPPKASKKTSVLAVSTVLYSVTDPVLPPGYSFNIIDNNGLVLYHTDRQKNLQENFLQEVDYQQRLVAAIASQSEATSDVSYYNRRYRAHIQPLPNVPWFLVTTYDKEYLESPYQYILTFSTAGIVLISIVSGLQFLLIFLIYYRPTKLKRKILFFEWLWPYRRGPGQPEQQIQTRTPRPVKYAIIFSLNIIYGLVLLAYNWSSSTLLPQTIASFLIAIIFSYVTAFALLKEQRDRRYGWVLASSVALSLLVLLISIALTTVPDRINGYHLFEWLVLLFGALFYVTQSTFKTFAKANQKPIPWKRSTLYSAAFFIGILVTVLLLLSQRLPLEHNPVLLQSVFLWASLYLLAILSIIVVNNMDQLAQAASRKRSKVHAASMISLTGHQAAQWLRNRFTALTASNWFSQHSYCLMIFSYLMISSMLSVWFLSSKTYEYEKRIWHKYDLYQVNEGLKKRDARLQTLYQTHDSTFHKINERFHRYARAKAKALYYPALQMMHLSGNDVHTDSTREVTQFDELMLNLRLVVTDLTAQTNGFVMPKGQDWAAISNSPDTLLLAFQHNPYFASENETRPPLVLAALTPRFLNTSIGDFLAKYWLLLLGFGIILFTTYWLLKFTILRLFGVQAFQFQKVIQIDDDLMDYERAHPDHRQRLRSQHKFIISMPFAGAHELFGQIDSSYTTRKIDLSQALEDTNFPLVVKDVLQQREKEIVLEHFSYGIDDRETNKRRLYLLENLLANGNSVTIISKLTPMQITAKYEELLENTKGIADKEELETRVSRWKDILSSFIKLYYSKLVCNRERSRLPARYTVRELIYHEMSVNRPYFERMNGTMISHWNNTAAKIQLSPGMEAVGDQEDEDIKEEVLMKIQSMAQPFYFSLWNTCSKEEKYILYDLADDGFVNTENKQVLLRLMEKGLIFYDESFHIMNESFRNFILANIKSSEALEMEKELRKHGRWSVYSTVILILIVSLIFFVVFAHESIVNQFIALLAGITAAVPYLLRLIGLVGLSSDGGNKE
uniref:Uncharacterized protein n=1 Tax=Roseihalotalea indica TaxID=2867963 RepID=A0AA49GID5_9BACT|nr:hypothetical protein K4G66_17640 [Tunicatimonas sp. TK19036]